jgi:uroporphyrinogen III methyltransferase / synthase
VSGIVYLVGAGPGDPGLLTLRGRECIEAADVIIHDYLVDPRLLRFARGGARVVRAGKRGDASERDRQQEEIHARMISEAKAGNVVVRLKGGDPFVFGRGGEEAHALVEAGIRFEVVPGVTSAVAVPAYAGIPLTERGLNSSFTVVTGHEAPGTRQPLDWSVLARVDTLVFLMALRGVRQVLDRLMGEGKLADTPAACIRSGTRPDQQTIVGTVGDLAEQVERAGFTPPAILVIGEIVRRRSEVAWFENRPLLGRRIVVTRAAEQAAAFVDALDRLGAEAIAAPTLVIEPVAPATALDVALATLDRFDWIVFTSARGVEVFFARLFASGADVRRLGRAALAAIGPATADALRRHGLSADVVPAEFRAEDLARSLGSRVRGKRVLLPRAAGARDVLPKALEAAGAEVVDVATYRARRVDSLPTRVIELLQDDAIDAITFTSSSTVRHFTDLLGGRAARTGRARIACIGPITAATARELGWEVHVEARRYTTEGLTAALIDYFAERR